MNGMTQIVQTVTRLMCGLIFIYALYIITHGHISPGGGFAGGIIGAGAFILLILSFGSEVVALQKEKTQTSVTESLALFIVLLLAGAGLFLGSYVFFNNYLPQGQIGELVSAGVIPLYNIFIGIEVAAALMTIFLGLVIFKEEVAS
ncbi:MAG: MnhB domain-containing protein [Bacteroidales bacterium]